MKFRKDLIEYLSKKTGIPVYDEIEITLEDNLNSEYRKKLWVKIDGHEYGVHRGQRKGGVFVFVVDSFKQGTPFAFKDIPIDYPVDKMYYKLYKSLEDFNIPLKTINSKYRNCEGNGWYSMVDIIEVDGLQFANC